MSQTMQRLQTLLYEALAEPIGLLLQTSNPRVLLQRLYRARALAGDAALAQLQFRTSPVEDGNIVIVKETVQVAAQPGAAQPQLGTGGGIL